MTALSDGSDITGVDQTGGTFGLVSFVVSAGKRVLGQRLVDSAGAPVAIALDGTDSTGITQLTGGVGIRGWLSGIFNKLPASLGAKASASSLSIVVASDQVAIPTTADNYAKVISSAANLTRLSNTTPYTSGQIIGAATGVSASNIITFNGVARSNGGVVRIERARMYKSNPTAAGVFQLVLFKSSPTLLAGDTASVASSIAVGDAYSNARVAGRLLFDMTGALVGTDGAEVSGTPQVGSAITTAPVAGSTNLYGILVTASNYTPSSAEAISFVLEVYSY